MNKMTWATIMAGVCVPFLVGCGGSDDDDGGQTSTPTPSVINVAGYWRGSIGWDGNGGGGGTSVTLTQKGNEISGVMEGGYFTIVQPSRIDGNNVYLRALSVAPPGSVVEEAMVVSGESMSGRVKLSMRSGRIATGGIVLTRVSSNMDVVPAGKATEECLSREVMAK